MDKQKIPSILTGIMFFSSLPIDLLVSFLSEWCGLKKLVKLYLLWKKEKKATIYQQALLVNPNRDLISYLKSNDSIIEMKVSCLDWKRQRKRSFAVEKVTLSIAGALAVLSVIQQGHTYPFIICLSLDNELWLNNKDDALYEAFIIALFKTFPCTSSLTYCTRYKGSFLRWAKLVVKHKHLLLNLRSISIGTLKMTKVLNSLVLDRDLAKEFGVLLEDCQEGAEEKYTQKDLTILAEYCLNFSFIPKVEFIPKEIYLSIVQRLTKVTKVSIVSHYFENPLNEAELGLIIRSSPNLKSFFYTDTNINLSSWVFVELLRNFPLIQEITTDQLSFYRALKALCIRSKNDQSKRDLYYICSQVIPFIKELKNLFITPYERSASSDLPPSSIIDIDCLGHLLLDMNNFDAFIVECEPFLPLLAYLPEVTQGAFI